MSDQMPPPTLPIEPLGHGTYRVRGTEGASLAWAVTGPEGTWVWLEGRAWLVPPTETAASPARARAADEERALTAPMPATVRVITVEPGQSVTAGDVLLRLEAMKMEMPVTAPRDGRVRQVNCRVGELVQPGVRLVDLE